MAKGSSEVRLKIGLSSVDSISLRTWVKWPKGFYKFLKRHIEGKKNSKQSTQINGLAKKVAVKKQRTTVIKPVDAAKPNFYMSKNPEVEVEVDVDAQVAEQKAKSVPAKVVKV